LMGRMLKYYCDYYKNRGVIEIEDKIAAEVAPLLT